MLPTLLQETAHHVVVDKPPGLVCSHELAAANTFRTVASETLEMNLQLSHRLDVPVTGCVVLGKSPKFAAKACREMQHGIVTKAYMARVSGKLPPSLTLGAPSSSSGGAAAAAAVTPQPPPPWTAADSNTAAAAAASDGGDVGASGAGRQQDLPDLTARLATSRAAEAASALPGRSV